MERQDQLAFGLLLASGIAFALAGFLVSGVAGFAAIGGWSIVAAMLLGFRDVDEEEAGE